ncbi:hypothetical protein [uncultured Deinococcus sp.]|uniref:hypothetical protein n=1 Tax=uncultured Deinococcus sp. TaxID=158789 RepID=UPI0025CE3415|nr:hypothetical protein [uncultured Deinococcus sp.]
MPQAPKYRFGKNALIRVAAIATIAADGTVTKPATAAFKVLCLAKDTTFGLENGTVDIENFCTGGRTVSVRDGTQSGTMELGETTWAEDDDVLSLMEDAAFSEDEQGGWLYVEILPLGAGTGKPVFDLIIDVNTWSMSIPSKGVITVEHGLTVIEGPIRGTVAA